MTQNIAPNTATAYDRDQYCLVAEDLNVHYGETHALHHINIGILNNKVTALIGPSGCGKSTFLRCFNRMNDEIAQCRVSGHIHYDGRDINAKSEDVVFLRRHIGMVFQKANPFPKSIFENVAYGVKIHGLAQDKQELRHIVETSLRKVALWDEVSDRLHSSATALSGGQQQRLCIARAIAINPDVLLMDEPCSALDPVATARIEELIHTLKEDHTIMIVTHSMSQAKRVSDQTAFFHMGEIFEFGNTEQIFNSPQHEKTRSYVGGQYG